MKDSPAVGDIVRLRSTNGADNKIALIVDVQKSEMLGDGGWTTFDYCILTSHGTITYITEAGIDIILS